jgi:hypothetical protein
VVHQWADHHSKQPGIESVQTKAQWRTTKKEIKRLQDAGIDPSKITKPGVYYPENSTLAGRTLDRLRRFFLWMFPKKK